MRGFILLYLIIGSLCTASWATQVSPKEAAQAVTAPENSVEGQATDGGALVTSLDKDKRETNEGQVLVAPSAHYVIRSASPKLLQQYANEDGVIVSAAPVFRRQPQSTRQYELDGYRPGQVISVDPRKLEPEAAQQQYVLAAQPLYEEGAAPLTLQPSRALIARPQAALGREQAVAHVGAALSVSDRAPAPQSFAPQSFAPQLDQDLYSLLAQPQTLQQQSAYPNRPVPRPKSVSQPANVQQVYARQMVATKPAAAKHRPKSHFPQQYLIETTPQQNVRQPQVQQVRPQYIQLAPAPAPKYVQQGIYDSSPASEYQPASAKPLPQPKYQIVRVPTNYRPQPAPQQYRVQAEDKRPANVVKYAQPQGLSATLAANSERPMMVLKAHQEKIRIQKPSETVRYSMSDPTVQIIDNQYYLRPIYRTSEQVGKMQLSHFDFGTTNSDQVLETTTPTSLAHSAIYVNKATGGAKKQPGTQNVQIEPHGETLDEQRSRLPPPKNNKAYTPEEFRALVAAGYSVTPVPVGVDEAVLPQFLASSRSDSGTEKRQERRRGRRPPYGLRTQSRAPVYLLDIPRAGANM